MLSKLRTFVSRKLLVAVLTAVLLAINNNLAHPLDPEAVKNLVTVIVAYLLGQSAVDVVTVVKNGK